MAKTKTPFFSMGAHGSVGQALTSQKRGQSTLLREKPVPTDPRTDFQLWHRHIYLFSCQCWNGLSDSDKMAWRRIGSKKHLLGMSAFLSSFMPIFKGLVAYWPLDELGGDTAFDFSATSNHATIFGATRVAGFFRNALYFDGLNDYLNCGTDPSLRPTSALTLLALFNSQDVTLSQALFATQTPAVFDGFYLSVGAGNLKGRIGQGAAPWAEAIGATPLVNDTRYAAALRFNGLTLALFLDGELEATTPDSRPLSPSTVPLIIGSYTPEAGWRHKGIIDEAMVFTSALSDEIITIIANRKESS